jgi:ABC-type bacteriocin/lantibiotic exporter with double-glycine peptidase domain
MANKRPNPIQRILALLRFQHTEISSIYFYAMMNGLVQLSLPLGIQSIISFVLGGSISTSIVILIFLVVAGVFLTGLFQVNQMRLIEKIQQQLFVRYSFEFARIIPRLNLKSIDKYYLPELVNRFFDTATLQKGLAKLLLDIPAATIQILFGLVLLSFYHPVFIFFGLALVLLVFFMLRYSGNRGLETSIEESDHKYAMAGWIEELARVVTTFKFSKGTSLHLQNTDKIVLNYLGARTNHFKILLFQYWTLIGFKIAITAAMLIVGSLLLVNQQLNIGQFIAAEIIILMVITSVEKLIINLDNVYDVLTAVEKLGKLTDQSEESDGHRPLLQSGIGMKVQVNDLSFEYQEGNTILSNLNFVIAPGEKVQVMGSQGSGKSTLLRLISGSYQPYKGVISLDDASTSNYSLDSIRKQTGVLLSNQELFKGSLLENVTLGDPEIPIAEINRLAEVIGLQSFLNRTPAGLYLPINPTGERLPRKIVQKLLLLRALLNKPRLLLLEEPWLGLELKYVEQIKNYLLNEIPNTTCLIVSNDIQFAEKANRVLVLEEGGIIADGAWLEIQSIIKKD